MLATTDDLGIVHLLRDPERIWAKHRCQSRSSTRRLMLSWVLAGKWQHFFLMLSDTGSLLVREKYSARAIDRVYEHRPSGWGWLGRRLDRYILELPVHQAVRDRFAFVTRNLAAAIDAQLADGTAPVSVLSAPCGLARDLCTTYDKIRYHHRSAAMRMRLYGVDLDYEGRVLEAARQRALARAVPIQLVRANLLDDATWSWLREANGLFSVVSCIGLAPWLTR